MKIYNLYIGSIRLQDFWALVRIGPFLVEIVSNYNEVVRELPQRGKIKTILGAGE